MKLKCLKCGWVWNTKSNAWQVSCPSCGYKVKNEMGKVIGNG
jgi:DNA-directed RNA polymerase subunit RPC12/RpoP